MGGPQTAARGHWPALGPAPAPGRFLDHVAMVRASYRATGRCYALVEIQGAAHTQPVLCLHGCDTEDSTLSKSRLCDGRLRNPVDDGR